MKQTAVDWLFDQMPDEYRLTRDAFEAYAFAKQKEKGQIADAWYDGIVNFDSKKSFEDYYNKTFNTNEK